MIGNHEAIIFDISSNITEDRGTAGKMAVFTQNLRNQLAAPPETVPSGTNQSSGCLSRKNRATSENTSLWLSKPYK